FYHRSRPLLFLHSFPTRRSSDLPLIYPGSRGVRSNGGVKSITSPSPRRTRRSLTAVIALAARSGSATPEITPQDCAIESIWHSSDRKSTRLNSSHVSISYAVFCL